MKIAILNRYFHPDESATSRMVSSLAFGIAKQGYDVQAVSSRQLLGQPGAKLKHRETIDGVTVHRIWTSRFGRRSIAGRVLDYSTYYLSAFVWLLRHTRRGDIVVIATDPPLLSVLAWVAALFTGVTRVNWLHDLYPEVTVGMGIAIPRPGYRLLQWLRDLSMRSASMNVAIGDRMAQYVESRRVNRARISVIHNWSDSELIRPVRAADNALRREWGLSDKFVVGYSGNLGRGHDFSTILAAAKALEQQQDIAFLFIGAGYQLASIEAQCGSLGLGNVVLRPYQDAARLSESLSVPDVHLASLKPSLESFMVPCKFYGVAAAGRPTIYIGDVDGEVPAILKTEDCGYAVALGDTAALVDRIYHLKASSPDAEQRGRNARDALLRRFDRRIAIDRWCLALSQLIEAPIVAFPQAVEAEK